MPKHTGPPNSCKWNRKRMQRGTWLIYITHLCLPLPVALVPMEFLSHRIADSRLSAFLPLHQSTRTLECAIVPCRRERECGASGRQRKATPTRKNIATCQPCSAGRTARYNSVLLAPHRLRMPRLHNPRQEEARRINKSGLLDRGPVQRLERRSRYMGAVVVLHDPPLWALRTRGRRLSSCDGWDQSKQK